MSDSKGFVQAWERDMETGDYSQITVGFPADFHIFAGDIGRSIGRGWHGEVVAADFDKMTITFRPISRLRWWWLRVRNAWRAARKQWRDIHEFAMRP